MIMISCLRSKLNSTFLNSLWTPQSSQSPAEFLVCSTFRLRAEIDHGEGWVQTQGGKYKIFILERRKCLRLTKRIRRYVSPVCNCDFPCITDLGITLNFEDRWRYASCEKSWIAVRRDFSCTLLMSLTCNDQWDSLSWGNFAEQYKSYFILRAAWDCGH